MPIRHNRGRRNTHRNRIFASAMDRTNALLTQQRPVIRTPTPSPPAYDSPPAYQPPTPKPKLLKRFKNIFTRRKTKVRTLTPPPPAYSSPPLPYQRQRTYGENVPTYQPGGNKTQRKSKKRRSHKRY